MADAVAQMYHKFVGKKAMLRVLDYPVQKNPDTGAVIRVASIGVEIPVTILNARTAWGRSHVLVKPLRGVGTVWVETTEALRIVKEWPEDATDGVADPHTLAT